MKLLITFLSFLVTELTFASCTIYESRIGSCDDARPGSFITLIETLWIGSVIIYALWKFTKIFVGELKTYISKRE